MEGLEKWQTAISQNLANSSTAGYKSVNVALRSQLTSASAGDFGSALSSEMVKSAANVDYSTGSFIQSDDPLSCAIEGDGFFQIQTADGQTKYTRNGQFRLDNDNRLVNGDGEVVIGRNGPISATPGGGDVSIRATGEVYQGTIQIGTLAVASIANQESLVPAGGGYVVDNAADAGVEEVANPKVLQGVYETSNVSAMREMVNMIVVSRAYEANQKAIGSQDASLGKAIQAFSA